MWVKKDNTSKGNTLDEHIDEIVCCANELENVSTNANKIILLQDMLHHFHYGQRIVINQLNKIQNCGCNK